MTRTKSVSNTYVIAYSFLQIIDWFTVVVVPSLSCVWLFMNPRAAAGQVSMSFTTSQSLLKLKCIESLKPFKNTNLSVCPSIRPAIRLLSVYVSLLLSFYLPFPSVFWCQRSLLIFPPGVPSPTSPVPFPPWQVKTWRQVRSLGRGVPNSWAWTLLMAIVLTVCISYILLPGLLLSFCQMMSGISQSLEFLVMCS